MDRYNLSLSNWNSVPRLHEKLDNINKSPAPNFISYIIQRQFAFLIKC